MNPNRNSPSGRRAQILVTSFSVATLVAGIYVWSRQPETVATEAKVAVKKASQQTAERQTEAQKAQRADSQPVAVWGKASMMAPLAETPAPAVAETGEEQEHARQATFDAPAMDAISSLRRGDAVVLPLLGGLQIPGKVNLVQQDENGWTRIGGELTGNQPGGFTINSNGEDFNASIHLTRAGTAYDIEGTVGDKLVMEEKKLGDVVCRPLPQAAVGDAQQITGSSSSAASAPQQIPPILSSRPNATAVAYLDFDGETVTDPAWNNGNTIVAQASGFTDAQITEIWKRVKEDYAAFNIDITTDLSRYQNAPVGRRMRCIFTPTDTAAPTSGGVAYLFSFSRAGSSYTSNIPCWAFNGGVMSAAEAASHEIGHTLGLNHDGRTSPSEGYYGGHGSGAVGWAPIMGVGYYKAVTQWSKGEYANANNKEDDIATISNATNGFGFAADEAGNTRATAANLTASSGTVNQAGVISQSTDSDFYAFTVAAGAVNIQAKPAAIAANVDILLELQDANGNVVASSNPDLALDASINTNVAAGTYYVKVQGTGRGDPLGDGYSSYGSIGTYTLSGTIPGGGSVVQAPVIASATTASGTAGQPFSYQIAASNSPTSYNASGLPAGLSVNTSTGLISGTPSAAGSSTVQISATNSAGTGSANLALTVTSPSSNSFANSAAITIRDRTTASAYPSTINVSGVSGTVSGVSVKLNGVNHTYPSDVDVVLVGPGGQKVYLMSDAGGGTDVVNATLTFSNSAANTIPSSGAITSGSYKPANYGGNENLPVPAPAGPYGTSLTAFNGVNPNGAWKLFIVDDAGYDVGSVSGGWSLTFTTSAAATSFSGTASLKR